MKKFKTSKYENIVNKKKRFFTVWFKTYKIFTDLNLNLAVHDNFFSLDIVRCEKIKHQCKTFKMKKQTFVS